MSGPRQEGDVPLGCSMVQSAENPFETALIRLCSYLWKGASPLQLLRVGGRFIPIGRAGRIEANFVGGDFQSQFVLLCPFLLSV